MRLVERVGVGLARMGRRAGRPGVAMPFRGDAVELSRALGPCQVAISILDGPSREGTGRHRRL